MLKYIIYLLSLLSRLLEEAASEIGCLKARLFKARLATDKATTSLLDNLQVTIVRHYDDYKSSEGHGFDALLCTTIFVSSLLLIGNDDCHHNVTSY